MEITRSALVLFYRIFSSCYIEIDFGVREKIIQSGREDLLSNDKGNLLNLENMLEDGSDTIPFDDFRRGMLGWGDRADSVLDIARELKKGVIDRDVIAAYFGSAEHSEAMLGDLRKMSEGMTVSEKFRKYFVFAHILTPVRIEEISTDGRLAGVRYENDGVSVPIRNVLVSGRDRERIHTGKTVLCHFPLVVDADPDRNTVGLLLSLQERDGAFMDAAKYFVRGGIDHRGMGLFSAAVRRISSEKVA